MTKFPITEKQRERLEEFGLRVALGLAVLALFAMGFFYAHESQRWPDWVQSIAADDLSSRVKQADEELRRQDKESLKRETAGTLPEKPKE